MSTVLGLDLGTNSIGWCLLKKQSDAYDFINWGVRIFQEGVNEQGDSRNLQRRTARGTRRNRYRRNIRKQNTITELLSHQMAPENDAERNEWIQLNPYRLRAEGLDRKLSLNEFGRVIYQIAMRRGFKSNRKGNNDEKGKVYDSIHELQKKINENGCRTLGEFYWKEMEAGNKIRGAFYTLRSQYSDEFDLLWNTQAQHHPELTDALKHRLKDEILFFQRPLKSPAVGKCTYEPKKNRAPKATLDFQNYRILEQLNRLEVIDRVSGEILKLSDSERERLYRYLQIHEKLKFTSVKKTLKWDFDAFFNLEKGAIDHLKGNSTNARLAKIFEDQWNAFTPEKQRQIVETLIYCHEESSLIRAAESNWNCNTEQIEKLLKLNLEPGYSPISLKVIRRLMPQLRSGMLVSEALDHHGYKRPHNFQQYDRLSEPPFIRNPIVNRTLHELRKVVNAIIDEYGKPDEIRIELARDLKIPKGTQRNKEMIQIQRKNTKFNQEAAEICNENGVKPTFDNRLRYKLWKECGGIDPYSGNFIGKEELFSPIYEIEHILPYSRTLNDSFNNKTLCHWELNKIKGNRTPYEAFGHDTQRYQEMIQRILKTHNQTKINFFKKTDLDDEEEQKFIERQLNDTRYISREAKSYLQQLFPNDGKMYVKPIAGQSTSLIRHRWGLNQLLNDAANEKDRSDHRHHAIDAFVIACSNQSLYNKLKFVHARKDEKRPLLDEPFPDFIRILKQKIDDIIVSHAPNHRTRGPLHEETFYGKTQLQDQNGKTLYVTRKAIHVLTEKEVTQIRDKNIRALVTAYIDGRRGNEFKKTMEKLESEPLCFGKKQRPIRKVRLIKPFSEMIPFHDRNGNAFRYAQSGANHHIELFKQTRNGKTKGVGRVVSNFEVAERKRQGQPIINKMMPNAEFICALHINDMIYIQNKGYFRVQYIDTSKKIALRLHTASTLRNNDERLFFRPNTIQADLLLLSPLGKIIHVKAVIGDWQSSG